MPKKLLCLVFVCSLLLAGISISRAEVIRSFNSVVRLQEDSTLDVTEVIEMDFENANRHGIYRTIPVKYSRYGNTYSIYIKILSVTDANNQALQYKTSHQGRDLKIRIGDPDRMITGVHTYKLHYEVLRAVNFFEGKPEVYWNATGDEWIWPMQEVSVRFVPPAGVDVSQLDAKSFYGPPGATTPAQTLVEANDIAFWVEGGLQAGEGLTFVVQLPEDSVTPPSIGQTFWWYFRDWWPAFILPLIALALLTMLYLRTGQDIDGDQAVAVEWSPPKDLSPAEVGTLMDEQCDMSDIIATLLDLAARGYLQIHEQAKEGFLFLSSKDYNFVRMLPEPANDTLANHERLFLDGIFEGAPLAQDFQEVSQPQPTESAEQAKNLKSNLGGKILGGVINPTGMAGPDVFGNEEQAPKPAPASASAVPAPVGGTVRLSDLKNKFYTHIPPIRKSIYNAMHVKKLFARNPENTRSNYRGVAMILGILGVVLFSMSLPWAIGFLVSGFFAFLTSSAMPAKTAKGSKKLRECKGFARFVTMVEKPRLELMTEEDPAVFGRMLPYAVVLGVADQWAEGFEGLLSEPPNWYVPYGVGAGYMFSSRMFMNDMGSGLNTMSSTFASAPSSAGSGGSGFSGGGVGGGFGGGGGGSW